MLNLPSEVEQDIKHFLKQIEHLSDVDACNTLELLIAKYLNFTESDFLLTKSNLCSIISTAKSNYTTLPTQVYLDGLENKNLLTQNGYLGTDELRIISIVQATIGELRKEKILGRPVKFNFKQF